MFTVSNILALSFFVSVFTLLLHPQHACFDSFFIFAERQTLTGDPDVVQVKRLLRHFGAKCLQSELKLLPVQRVLHAHLLGVLVSCAITHDVNYGL